MCRCLTAAPVLLCHEAAQGWLIPSSHPARRSGSAPLAHPCTELRQEAVELVALHAPPLSIHKAGQRVLLAQRSRACSGSSREERGEPCRGHPARRERECTWKSSPSHAALGRCPTHPPTNCSHLQSTKKHTQARTWAAQASQAAREARQRVGCPAATATAGSSNSGRLQSHRGRHVASLQVTSRRGGPQGRIAARFCVGRVLSVPRSGPPCSWTAGSQGMLLVVSIGRAPALHSMP